jgi:hypothetical protein
MKQIIVQAFSDPFSKLEQPQRAGCAGSCFGPAGPEAAARRADSRGPTCVSQSIGRKLRSQDASIEEPAGNCISFRQPTLPEEGGGSGVGGRGGTGELGLRPLPRGTSFRRMHGPRGTDRQIRTAAASR